MSVSIADMIAYARAMGIAVADKSDADLTVIANQILNRYCAAKPIHVFTEAFLTTVADQPNYNVPAGTLGVDVLFWSTERERSWPALATELTGMGGIFQSIMPSTSGLTELDFESPEQAARWNALTQSWNAQWSGSWRSENTGTDGAIQVWLSPVPTNTGDIVPATSWRARPITQIDASMQAMLNDVVLAYVNLAKASTQGTTGRIKLGDYEKQTSTTGMAQLMTDSRAVISNFELLLHAPFVGSIG